ncbi:hypothetical protein M758_10G057900 [Ceratodon purpureus]|nr:hypothetical protein M758_10G057900 [Ceratodon purpureus]
MAAMMVAASPTAALWCHFSSVSTSKWKSISPSISVSCAMRRERPVDIEVAEEEKAFVYRRASAAERWPNSSDALQQRAVRESVEEMKRLGNVGVQVRDEEEGEEREHHVSPIYGLMRDDKARDKARQREIFNHPQKDQTKRLKRMNKLALKKAVDWKDRTARLAAAICELEVTRPVEDVLEGWPEQLNNEDLSVVLGNVGRENWRRALELYECLNLRKWYTPNTRMLATILSVLGRANQVEVARELFLRAEPELTADHIQVFNGIMGVYAKQGKWQAVQQILELMESRGCEPDIITFNTVINARCKGELQPGMAIAFLKEMRRARVKPDLITFNTLLGGCIANKNFEEAREIVKEMVRLGYEPDAYSKFLLGKKKTLLQEIR